MDKLFCQKCDNMLVTRIEIVDAKGPEGVSVDSDNESDSEGEQTRLVCYCRQCNFSIDNTEMPLIIHLQVSMRLDYHT